MENMKRRSKKNSNTANLLLITALVLIVVVFVFAPTGQFFAADYTIDNGNYILELTPSIASSNYILTLHGEETFSQTIPLSKISSTNYELTPIAALDGDQDGVLDYAMEDGELRALDLCPDTEYIARPTHDEQGNEIQYISTDPLTIPNREGVNEDGCVPGYLDNDNDGVINDDDQCPQTPSTEAANTIGCSVSQIDTDSDGVNDLADICPNTPPNTNVYTDAERNGCSQAQALADSDSDKVYDSRDQCPNTPEIQKQNSNGDLLTDATGNPIMVPNSIDLAYSTTNPDTGCAPGETPLVLGAPDDSDNDGVSNEDDLCPDTPAADVALVYTSGNRMCCVDSQLVDADTDGIYDSKDQCPNTAAGAAVNSVGCADSDGDTVIDPDDLCPGTPAGSTVDSTGCAISQTDIDGDGVLNENDEFPYDPTRS